MEDIWQPGALMTSNSPEWYTPTSVIDAVIETLGHIDLDPCAEPAKGIPATTHFTEEDNGLAQHWYGKIYMNAPYGRVLRTWVQKMGAERSAGNVTEAILLVPARTDTRWWREMDENAVCFIHGRLTFSGYHSPAPFPCAAAYIGDNKEHFKRAFAQLGTTYTKV